MFLQLLTALSILKVAFGAACDRTYTSSSGTVTSPSFSTSNNYDNNMDCNYDISVSGRGIRLSWTTFDVKGTMPNCYDDYVEIYIGCGLSRTSIGKYCSDNTDSKPFDVYSPDCLRLKFHTDSSNTGSGFKALYSSFSLSSGSPYGVGGDCSGYSETYPKKLFYDKGVLSSPNWPRDYPGLRDCYWRIDVPSSKGIKIAFMDFHLKYDSGCEDDKVKVKEGYSSDSYDGSSTLKSSICGRQTPFDLTSTRRRIWVRFKSDNFGDDRGFVIGYVMYDTSSGSSGSSGGSSTVGIVVGIIIVLVVVGCIFYVFVYRKRVARRQQHQAAVIVPPPQPMTVHHAPPPPQPAGYAPPPQQGYVPPPQQGYAPPPPQPGYGPPPQPGYAPPPYSQVAGAPYPQQDKPGPYPAAPPPGGAPYPPGQPGGAPPYPPEQPGGAPPYPPGQPGGAPPYPPGQPGGVPPYPPAQPGGAPPYPPEQPAGGAAPYPTAPPSSAPYPPQ